MLFIFLCSAGDVVIAILRNEFLIGNPYQLPTKLWRVFGIDFKLFSSGTLSKLRCWKFCVIVVVVGGFLLRILRTRVHLFLLIYRLSVWLFNLLVLRTPPGRWVFRVRGLFGLIFDGILIVYVSIRVGSFNLYLKWSSIRLVWMKKLWGAVIYFHN